jgi:hypothetical protein
MKKVSMNLVCDLAPTKGNGRNSEGDFLRAPNGDILFAYSRYNTSGGGDDAPCDIALIRWPNANKELNAVAMEMMFFYDWLGKSSDSCYYGCHFVLFDSKGEIVVLEMDDATRLEQKGADSLGPLSPTSGWYRSPLHSNSGIDPDARYDQLGFSFNNSNGTNCAYFPASDAKKASGYDLPAPYKEAYGIVCFTGMWSPDTSWMDTPDNPLYQ